MGGAGGRGGIGGIDEARAVCGGAAAGRWKVGGPCPLVGGIGGTTVIGVADSDEGPFRRIEGAIPRENPGGGGAPDDSGGSGGSSTSSAFGSKARWSSRSGRGVKASAVARSSRLGLRTRTSA